MAQAKIRCHKLAYPFHPNWLISCPICMDSWEVVGGALALACLDSHVNHHWRLSQWIGDADYEWRNE